VQLRTSDGVDVGGAVMLTLKGDNPVVDRRAMNFSAGQNGIRKVDNGLDGGSAPPQNNEFGDTASNASGDVAASGSAAPFIPASAFEKTPEEEIHTKPGGCGCSVPGLGTNANLLFMAGPLAVLALVVVRRKRRVG